MITMDDPHFVQVVIAKATVVSAIATIIAALLAGWAVWQATKINEAQKNLTESIHKQQKDLTKNIHEQQQALTQRQLFIPLFEQVKGLHTINSNKPVWTHIINAVNVLDLLAVCWEGQLVDEKIILRSYREIFIRTYNEIQKCTNPPETVLKDGAAMLNDSRSATSLYKYLMEEHINRDKPDPLRTGE